MTAYLVGAIDIHDEEKYGKYRAGVGPLFSEFPGLEVLSVDDDAVVFEGQRPANHQFIIKFQSIEQIKQFLDSDVYRAAAVHRRNSSVTRYIMAMRGTDEG
ncbi:MAG: DUF1330 domain-containing protein [Sphingomonadaceae bacterium]